MIDDKYLSCRHYLILVIIPLGCDLCVLNQDVFQRSRYIVGDRHGFSTGEPPQI